MENKQNNYVGYEYRTITVKKEQESLWVDSCRNFGWTLEKSEPATVKHVWGPLRVMLAPLALLPGMPFAKMVQDHPSDEKVDLHFKRDRTIDNKNELNRLQQRFEADMSEINRLEESSATTATAIAYTIGLIGTILMAGATFAYLSGAISLCIVLAIPGFVGWILPYFVHKSVLSSRKRKNAPTIEQRHEDVDCICHQAHDIIG